MEELSALAAENAEGRQALILEDTNGDGKADKRTVFAGDSTTPPGSSSQRRRAPRAARTVFLKDTNATIARHEGDPASRLRLGDTPTRSTASRSIGWRALHGGGIFHRSQVESPWAPTTRLVDGGVFRFEPRTWKFEVYVPHNFPNPHGHVFDSWGATSCSTQPGAAVYGPRSRRRVFPTPKPITRHGRQGAHAAGRRRRDPVQPSLPERCTGNVIVLNVIGFRGLLNTAGRRRRRSELDGSRADSQSSDETSVRSMPRSAPTARSMSPTGTIRSSGTCSTTCATSRATACTADLSCHRHRAAARHAGEGRGRTDRAATGPAQGARGSRPLSRQDRAQRAQDRRRDGGAADGTAHSTESDRYEHHMLEALWCGSGTTVLTKRC